jgi:hypothetical protein
MAHTNVRLAQVCVPSAPRSALPQARAGKTACANMLCHSERWHTKRAAWRVGNRPTHTVPKLTSTAYSWHMTEPQA